MRRSFVVAAAWLVMVGSVRAEEDAEIRAAQRDLQSAKSHLQAATHDYGGHRKQALERVNNALDDVRQALTVAGRGERREEKKDQQLENKQQKLERQIDGIEKQQEKLENK